MSTKYASTRSCWIVYIYLLHQAMFELVKNPFNSKYATDYSSIQGGRGLCAEIVLVHKV